jgi:hypothetical protein
MKKTAGKILFGVAMLFLVVAVVFLSLLVNSVTYVFGVVGLTCVLAALIFLLISFVLFLKDDDEHNRAEKKEDAPKAH